MTVNQLSVFVENRQGALSRIADILALAGVDIRAMSLAETQNFGVLRLIVNNTKAAEAALKKNNIVFHITQVVAAAVEDRPGGLAKILRILSENGIDILYMYAFVARPELCRSRAAHQQYGARAAVTLVGGRYPNSRRRGHRSEIMFLDSKSAQHLAVSKSSDPFEKGLGRVRGRARKESGQCPEVNNKSILQCTGRKNWQDR